jgi:uncharacterized membrane protein YkvA (DUF1232 family)
MLARLRHRARLLKADLYALYLAIRDPRVPLVARIVVACVVGYAFSPIDLIPDFVPILGYLDDLVLLPLGIALALKLIPPNVMAECRVRAQAAVNQSKPTSRVAVIVIVGLWVLIAGLVAMWVLRFNAR